VFFLRSRGEGGDCGEGTDGVGPGRDGGGDGGELAKVGKATGLGVAQVVELVKEVIEAKAVEVPPGVKVVVMGKRAEWAKVLTGVTVVRLYPELVCFLVDEALIL